MNNSEVIIENDQTNKLYIKTHNYTISIPSKNCISSPKRYGDCGVHALRICLKYEGIDFSSIKLLNKINITNYEQGNNLTGDNHEYLADIYKKNVVIITTNYNTNDKTLKNTAML